MKLGSKTVALFVALAALAAFIGCARPSATTGQTDVAAAATASSEPSYGANLDRQVKQMTGSDSNPTPPAPSAPETLDAKDAVGSGQLQVTADGVNSLDRISVTVRRVNISKGQEIHVRIPMGSTFLNGDSDAQNMVVTEDAEAVLYAGTETTSVDVAAACIDMHKEVPSSSNSLTLNRDPIDHQDEVMAVLRAGQSHDAKARQMAVWIVRSDPGDSTDMPYIAGQFDGGADRDVQQQRVDEARTIIKDAGLNPGDYRIYQ